MRNQRRVAHRRDNRVSWDLNVVCSIRQIGPGVIFALGLIWSRVRLASALAVVAGRRSGEYRRRHRRGGS